MVQTLILGPLGTNCYIYTDDSTGLTAVVDPGYPDQRLFAAVAGRQVSHILLTHGHADHILGAHELQMRTGAKVVCHPLECKRLDDPDQSLYNGIGIYTVPQPLLQASQTVDDGDQVQVGDTVFTVLHTPGHTDGSVCYLAPGLLFSGDTLFAGSYGRIDFPTGSGTQMTASFRKLCALPGDYRVLPGHDGETTLDMERAHNPLAVYP